MICIFGISLLRIQSINQIICSVTCAKQDLVVHFAQHSYSTTARYFQHAHFIPIVGVGKRGEYSLVHGDLPRQHQFGTTLRFTGPVPADSRQ